MKVLYVRISSTDQKLDRQKVKKSDYNYLVEDKVSGVIPFFERPGGMEIMNIALKEGLTEIAIWQIDRLGRDLRDILNTVHFFSNMGICVHFISQNIKTIDEEGNENPISKLILSTLGIVAEMNRKQIRENQLQGIAIAKAQGKYLGRMKGTSEDLLTFLSKPKNKKAVELLNKGYKGTEVCKIVGLSINTITKIKKQINP